MGSMRRGQCAFRPDNIRRTDIFVINSGCGRRYRNTDMDSTTAGMTDHGVERESKIFDVQHRTSGVAVSLGDSRYDQIGHVQWPN